MAKADGTHLVMYEADGSHGLWVSEGSHTYADYEVFSLSDDCSAGTAWDTWNLVAAFDYGPRTGLGGSTWPRWMETDFTSPGPGPDPTDPANGPIYRWGNPEWDCSWYFFDYCRLENGPTGPASKSMWDTEQLR